MTNETMDIPSSEIYDACLEMNWDLAMQLCRTLPPSALRYQDGDTLETPLYVACQNQPPLPLVQTLLTLWPDATSTKSRHGDIPIHVACRYEAHISVVQALLECDPRSATHRTRFGTTPLVALWEPYGRMLQLNAHRINDENIASLATANPTMYQKYRIIQLCHSILTDDSVGIEEKCQLDIFNQDNLFHEKWILSLELSKAVAIYRENCDETTIRTSFVPVHLVHAAVALKSSGCPLWVLFYTAVHYSEQYSMVDGTGRCPLHIAVGPENSSGAGNTNTLLNTSSSPPQQWKFMPKEYWSIRLALHFHPQSAILFDPNEPTGRYPLHTALCHGHQWHYGVKLLVDAAPDILHQIDPTAGLYPFQLAASLYMKYNAIDGLDLIYALLRYDPTILKLCQRGRVCPDDTDDNLQSSRVLAPTTQTIFRHRQQGLMVGSSIVVIFAIGIVTAVRLVTFETSS